MGPHDVIVTDALPNEVQFYRDSDDKTCLKDSQQRDLIKGWSTGNCKRLIFKKSENTQIIVQLSGNTYQVESTRLFRSIPIIVSYGADKQLKLNLPFKKAEATVDFYYPYKPRGEISLGVSLQSPIHQSVLVSCGSHTCLFQQATPVQRD